MTREVLHPKVSWELWVWGIQEHHFGRTEWSDTSVQKGMRIINDDDQDEQHRCCNEFRVRIRRVMGFSSLKIAQY